MAKVGAQRAAELTGKSKSTVQRAMNSGKLSFELDSNGRRVIDVSELERVFGLSGGQEVGASGTSHSSSVEAELEKASQMIEMERLKMRIKMLEDKLDMTEMQLEDLKAQRDQWQKQAAQTLITSQYSQKQAEDMREELKERERRTREKREKIAAQSAAKKKLAQKMHSLEADNENAQNETFSVQGLWKKIKNNG